MSAEFDALQRRLDRAAAAATGAQPSAPARPAVPDVSTPLLDVRCLGPFLVILDGDALKLPGSGKAVAIVKLLATRRGRPVVRDELFERIWPEADAGAAANRLRVALYALRQAAPQVGELVVYENGSYRLAPAAEVRLDADDFELRWEEGQRLERVGDTAAAIASYTAAERLYRGDFLEDDAFEEWTVVRREYLRDLYLNLLVRLATLAFDRGDEATCIRRCQQILRHDSCNEDAYDMLIRSHLRGGRRARALRWFEVCERTLRVELDAAPSPALLALRDEIA